MLKLSFIIPAYNVEHYLEQCLDSLLGQAERNFEIIVVDDGSTDRTPDIIAAYGARHSCINTVRQANSGQGQARNVALAGAKGEYIWFIDADDWMEEKALSRVYALLGLHGPDVLFCNYVKSYPDGNTSLCLLPPTLAGRLCNPGDLPEGEFASIACWAGSPFRMITRRAFLSDHGILFPTGLFYEDHPFSMQVMRHAASVFVDAPPSYIYRQRSDSTVHRQDRRIFDFLTIRTRCLELFRQYHWNDKYPNLYASYLLPGNFLNVHVPVALQREFLEALRADLHSSAEKPETVIQGNLGARACLLAVQYGSLRLYHLYLFAEKMKKAAMGIQIHRLTLRVGKLPFSALRQMKRILKKYLRGDNAKFFHAHPSVKTDAVHLEIRRNIRDHHYIIAHEEADLSCTCVFETGFGQISFGRRCSVGNGTLIICSQEQGIRIGNNVMISWGCTIADNNSHSLDPELRHNDAWHWKLGAEYGQLGLYKDWSFVKRAPIRIEDDAWVGFESVVLAGVVIGHGAVVGARSVVTASIPPYTVFAGNPARFVRLVPRNCGWGWQELTAALRATPECAVTCSAKQYLAAAIRYSRETLRIQDLPALADETRGEMSWVQTALELGAAHAEWLDGESPSLVLRIAP